MQTSSPALSADNERLNWPSSIPFFAVHLMCLAVFWVGAKPVDVAVCVGLYVVRMWGITVGYHRYFSHRAFKTGRVFQFILALVGSTSIQKGVLWWAANHRHHHRFSDQPEDLHSPIQRGFWWSHVSWILCDKYEDTRMEAIKDFARYPELVWLNRLHLVPPVLLAVALYFIGGLSMLVWGFFVSTTLLWHGTFTINSLSHIFGKRRYKTTDTSRNNWLLALITLGEGWHNNHHYHQNTANQGWFWWEVDISYYTLKALSWVGVVEGLRKPSEATKYAFRKYTAEERAALAAPVRFWGAAGARSQLVAASTAAKAAAGDAARAAGDAAKVAGDKVREALAAAADHLPGSATSPQGLLKRQ